MSDRHRLRVQAVELSRLGSDERARPDPETFMPRSGTRRLVLDAPSMGPVATETHASIVQPDAIAARLRAQPRWLGWRYETRKCRATKVPYRASRPGQTASCSDAATWTDFVTAMAAYEDGKVDGIGFALGDGYFGIDLDRCVTDGAIDADARATVDAIPTYAEFSPSRAGLHLIGLGALPPGARRRGRVEAYDSGRYFTVTGDRLPGAPDDVAECTAAVAQWHAKTFRDDGSGHNHDGEMRRLPSPLTDDDGALVARAGAAPNGAKFSALWSGNTAGYVSQSEADIALCNHLAYWTSGNPARMDTLFRRSGLMRAKWDEPRGDRSYSAITIAKAIDRCRHADASQRGNRNGWVRANPSHDGAARAGEPTIPLGHRDPESHRLVLSPRRTLPTAEAYIRAFHTHPVCRTLYHYAGRLLTWRDNRYTELEDEAVKRQLQAWLHQARRYVIVDRRTGARELADFESNPTTVREALETLRVAVHLAATTVSPSWLDDEPHPPALEILPCRSMNVHIPTGCALPATPALFTTSALDFDYDAHPATPVQWLTFLEQLWGDDAASIELLQEWFGYCLIADTSRHKMLLIVGPRRGGKGTIARVQTRLVGGANVVGPTTSSLAGPFGLQPLIGRSLAIVSDARFASVHVATVVERLLNISGEDTLTIDRKFLGAVSMKLPTRFMFLTNELPRVNDASTALAGRFLVLRLERSFYGAEDTGLTDRLLTELPGILRWALEGWTRLQQRGRFLQPQSAADSIRDMEHLASPVTAFIADDCLVGPHYRVLVDHLYSAWKAWCEQGGRIAVGSKQEFGRQLSAAAPSVHRRKGTDDRPFYQGIALQRADSQT